MFVKYFSDRVLDRSSPSELRANISLENSTVAPRAVLRFLRAKVVPVSSSRVSKPRLNIYFSTATRFSSYQTSHPTFSLSNDFQNEKRNLASRIVPRTVPRFLIHRIEKRKTWKRARIFRGEKRECEDDPRGKRDEMATSPEANWNWNRCCRPRGLSALLPAQQACFD